MAQQYGLSFQPGADNGQQQSGYRAPVQQAIKLLSLRLPSVVGARSIAPQALLEGGGSQAIGGPGGLSGEALIEWLRKQMRQSQAQMPPQAQSVFQPEMPPAAAGSPLGLPSLSIPNFGRGDTPQMPTFGPSAGSFDTGGGQGGGSGDVGGSSPRFDPPRPAPPPEPPRRPDPPPEPPRYDPPPPPVITFPTEPPPSADPDPAPYHPPEVVSAPEPSPFDYPGGFEPEYRDPFDVWY